MAKNFTKWHRGMTKQLVEAGVKDGPPIQVLMELLSFWDGKDGEIFPSREAIERSTGYPFWTISRAFATIRASGLLLQPPLKRGHVTNRWIVTPELKRLLDSAPAA